MIDSMFTLAERAQYVGAVLLAAFAVRHAPPIRRPVAGYGPEKVPTPGS